MLRLLYTLIKVRFRPGSICVLNIDFTIFYWTLKQLAEAFSWNLYAGALSILFLSSRLSYSQLLLPLSCHCSYCGLTPLMSNLLTIDCCAHVPLPTFAMQPMWIAVISKNLTWTIVCRGNVIVNSWCNVVDHCIICLINAS